MKTIEPLGGDHIRDILKEALETAIKDKDTIQFEFNGATYTVYSDDTPEIAKARAEAILGFPILTPTETQAQATIRLETQSREWAEAIANAGVDTEEIMRKADVPWLKEPEELVAYIIKLVDRPHDYGTCVYAMSMAAVAAYYHVSTNLGVTGFQASMADLDFIRRTRHMKGPFMIMDGHDMLYPQSDLQEKLDKFLIDNRKWAAEEAKKKLIESPNAHPDVIAHWNGLVAWSDL